LPDIAGQGLAVLEVKGFPIVSNWYTVHLQGKRLSHLGGGLHGLPRALRCGGVIAQGHDLQSSPFARTFSMDIIVNEELKAYIDPLTLKSMLRWSEAS